MATLLTPASAAPGPNSAGLVRDSGSTEEPVASEQRRPGERFAEFFAPYQSEIATLSPDGKRLAYSMREADVVSIVVVEVDRPSVALGKFSVISDKLATPMIALNSGERVPGRINWMRWIHANRLVIETNRIFATRESGADWTSVAGEILAVDADGKNPRSLADARRMTRMTVTDAPNVPSGGLDPSGFIQTRSEAPESSEGGGETESITQSAFRPPRVFGFDPERPDSLLVLGHTQHGFGLYSIHSGTGKLRYLDEAVYDSRMVMLLDRAAKPRLGVAFRTNQRFPLPIVLEARKGWKAFHELDTHAARAGIPPGFSISPDNYFAHRHVPLGFDQDGTTLYFASNVGRDTYGIYALNLETHTRLDVAVESPSIDLWEPVPGTFPDVSTSWFSESFNAQGLADAVNTAIRESEIAAVTGPEYDDPGVPRVSVEIPPTSIARLGISIQPGRTTDDTLLVFDRHSGEFVGVRVAGSRPTAHWFRRHLAEAQALLEKKFQPNAVEIREWDTTGNRLLFTVSGPSIPGNWFILDRAAARVTQFAARAPWLEGMTSPAMLTFAFTSPEQVPIKGSITIPRVPRQKPVPAVFIPPRMPWQPWTTSYKVEIQALADMGFAVVEYSGRGAWGRGAALRAAIRDGYEDAQVGDLLATADYVASHFAVAPQRFAVLGVDHGGHVALRALELAPDRFRAAVAIGAPVNLRTWLAELEWQGASSYALLIESMFGSRARQSEAPLLRDVAKITRPTLLFNYRGPLGTMATNNYRSAVAFADNLARRIPATEIVELSQDYMNGLPKARAAVFAHIEEFLNANIYDFAVKAGQLQVDEAPRSPESCASQTRP